MKKHLLAILIIIFTLMPSSKSIAAQDIDKKITQLENKVAKKFSNTFCNSTGFGISNEGALKFSLGETKSEFDKNPLIEKVNMNSIKDQIIDGVSDTCYYFELTKNDLDALTLKYQKK